MESVGFSVIIPTLNEVRNIAHTVGRIRKLRPGVEIVVSDGKSTDGTPELAESLGVVVVTSERGRGTQCNTGAREAAGSVLIFLHADARLPENAFPLLESYFRKPDVLIGTFLLRFDRRHWAFRLYSWFTRFESIFTRFGDCGIVVTRLLFDSLGGFPDWPLFEDVELLRRARRTTTVHTLPACMTTSARMFLKNGVFRQQLRSTWLMIRFLTGASPQRLYRKYYR